MKGVFYNTIDEPASELEASRTKVDRQEDIILDLFRKSPRLTLTPFEVHERVLPDAPITSIRRALTNLTDSGLLEKLASQKIERWGKRNYQWRLAGDGSQLRLF
jgi:Fe2+ or Zn2+ uptake regulation protein